MILGVDSSIKTFKSVQFAPGLNVLLADTRPESKSTETRNSAGKTSVVEIIHFLLGSNCDKDSLFRVEALINESFTATFKIDGKLFQVLRTGSDPSKVFLLDGADGRLAIKKDKQSGKTYVSNTHWRRFLAETMFRIPALAGTSVFDEPGAPSFRALFAYFARRRNNGGLLQPEQQSKQQQRGDWQVNLSYLLERFPIVMHRILLWRSRLGTLRV